MKTNKQKNINIKLTKRQVQAVLSAAGTWLGEIDEYKSKHNGRCNTFWMIMYDDLVSGVKEAEYQYNKLISKK
tara:strand:+ start:188 stop:406 length:219 start_codon:yes stop_codon:yes gene_type:complete